MSDAPPLEEQIVAAIRRIVRAVDLHSRRLVESCGLTGPQLIVLKEITRLQPTSPTAIARAVHLSQGTVTGILSRLEVQGLISREPSSTDRRSVVIRTTEAGNDILRNAPSLLQDHFRRELSTLEQWERHQMLSTLMRVASLMQAEKIDASPMLVGAHTLDAAEPSKQPGAPQDAVT